MKKSQARSFSAQLRCFGSSYKIPNRYGLRYIKIDCFLRAINNNDKPISYFRV